MILLTKATANTNLVFTLEEKTTLTTPKYLFAFTSDSTNVEYTCISADLSVAGAARERANLFTITEGVDDRTNGSLILGREGMYHYIVYEQTSTTNLDPTLATDIVQRGFMRLISTTSEASNYIAHSIPTTYVEHG